jgi:hypothetical protein
MAMTAEYLQFILYLRTVESPGSLVSTILGAFEHVPSVGFASVSVDSYTDNATAQYKRSFSARTHITSPETRRSLALHLPNIRKCSVDVSKRNTEDGLADFKLLIRYLDAESQILDLEPDDNLGNFSDRDALCPMLRISLRIDTLFSLSPELRAAFVDQVVRAVADSATIRSGFVSCEPAERTRAGWLYTPPFGEELPMDMVIRELAWWRFMKMGRKLVRGVYWGNVWGPEIVERVAPLKLLDSISGWKVKHLTQGILVPGGASVEPLAGGSVFVKLSKDPLDSSETWRDHGGLKFIGLFDSLTNIQCAFAAWVYMKLRELDLLL